MIAACNVFDYVQAPVGAWWYILDMLLSVRLLGFYFRGPKLVRFLAKTENTPRKPLCVICE